MYERVNPSHPDKLADRIAGAMVDAAYAKCTSPHIAVEVMLGHGVCHIIAETDVHIELENVNHIVHRIAGENVLVDYLEAAQDVHLSDNQEGHPRCGDNGIFRGAPVTQEQRLLTNYAKKIYSEYPTDGKYIIDDGKLIICQSNAAEEDLRDMFPDAVINPLGKWTGGTDTDTGAVNRKLGSDMGDSVTGGGLHGKDLSKADVSVNIYCWLKAQEAVRPVELSCAIGDEKVDGLPYEKIMEKARMYIDYLGGFEKFAEWGLI